MKNCQSLCSVNAGPNAVNVLPFVLYENVAVRPEPGWMFALARSQIVPPETAAPAASEPVPVVVHPLVDMVSPLVIETRVAPLSLRMPIHADWSRSMASPARSPLAMDE